MTSHRASDLFGRPHLLRQRPQACEPLRYKGELEDEHGRPVTSARAQLAKTLQKVEVRRETEPHAVDKDERCRLPRSARHVEVRHTAHPVAHLIARPGHVSGVMPVRELALAISPEAARMHDGPSDCRSKDVSEEIVQQRARLHRRRGWVEVESHRAQLIVVALLEAEAYDGLLCCDPFFNHAYAPLNLRTRHRVELVHATRVDRVRDELCDIVAAELGEAHLRAFVLGWKEPAADKVCSGDSRVLVQALAPQLEL